ncbi:MAG: NgoFVII family restriction endonuclease [Leptospiraceae bacterium]|nr:NgoFVII family restriction endonuclease [Leptospiraceae bacterium]MCP5511467.1 NgoFVII family restriction endonuclease [Leptospiraceae bacterium]
MKFFKKNKNIPIETRDFQKAIQELLSSGREFFLITGYLTNNGLTIIKPYLDDILNKGNSLTLIVGEVFPDQDYEIAKEYLNSYPSLFRFNISKDSFIHAKIYASFEQNSVKIIFGSSNITHSGMNSNIEFNSSQLLVDKEATKIKEIINTILEQSIPYEPSSKKIHIEKLTEDVKMALTKDKVFAEFERFEIENWDYEDIESEVEEYNSIITKNIHDLQNQECEPDEFIKDYLFQNIWAITESAGWSNLKDRIQQEDPRRVTKSILNMIASTSSSPDEVLKSGRLTNVLGESILSEILHRAYPDRYPILNRKSAFGFLNLDGRDFRANSTTSQTPYETFIKVMNRMVEYWKEYLGEDSDQISDKIKYRCVDHLCQEMYESSHYKDIRDMWNSQNKGES